MAFSDVKKIIESNFCTTQDVSPSEIQSSVNRSLFMIKQHSFSIDYDLLLNKHFIAKFSDIVQPKGFVVERTMKQDHHTVYRRSQPDTLIYRSGGGYITGTTIIGVAINIINDNEIPSEVTDGMIEMKKASMTQKTKTSSKVVQTIEGNN